MTETAMRTKRRYAHELYPYPEEGEVRPLSVEVPYLYARAIGFDVWGTGWFDTEDGPSLQRSVSRTELMIGQRERALLADALLQGLTGDEAWKWAEERSGEESGEWVYERAVHYGVKPGLIKPYPCGPEPDHHDHSEPIQGNLIWSRVTRVDGPESACPDCCEPVPAGDAVSS